MLSHSATRVSRPVRSATESRPVFHARAAAVAAAPQSAFLSGTGAARLRAEVDTPRARSGVCFALGAQANLFSRIGRVVKSYANAVVSSAEDPEKVLDQVVMEMQEDLIKMRQASAQVIASKSQLENKYKQAQETSDEWYRRAQLALDKGDEELAKEALVRRKSYQEKADSMKVQVEQQIKAADQLVENTRILEAKMAEAKSKKDTLKARAASAKTNQKVNEVMGSMSGDSAFAAFDKMEEKVMAMEAEADAVGLLSAGGESGLEDKFKALEGNSIEDELAALKQKSLPKSGPAGQLPGRTVQDAIDVELDAMKKNMDK
mmetsp:Transcript_29721/g.96850  ORF Transcript_29721/g.96850 Transcript_29721/m.96850 type:complete len:319 (-) Transcript_29721:63-1019(-)